MSDDDFGTAPPAVHPQHSSRSLLSLGTGTVFRPKWNDYDRRWSHNPSATSREPSAPSRGASELLRYPSTSLCRTALQPRDLSASSHGASLLSDYPSASLRDASSSPSRYSPLQSRNDSSSTAVNYVVRQLPRSDCFSVNIPLRTSCSSSSVGSSSIGSNNISSAVDSDAVSSSDGSTTLLLRKTNTNTESASNSPPYTSIQYSSEDAASAKMATSSDEDASAWSTNLSAYNNNLDTDTGCGTDEDASGWNTNTSAYNSLDTDNGGKSETELSSSGNEVDSEGTSLPSKSDITSSSDYEEYSYLTNRNVNAAKEKKSKKSKSGESSDKDPLLGDEKAGSTKEEGNAEAGSKKKSEGKRGSKKDKGSGGKDKDKEGKDNKEDKSKKKKKDKSKDKSKKKKKSKDKKKDDEESHGGFSKFLAALGESSEYPAGIFFLLGGEFCERFAYYGIRAILIMYLTGWLALTPTIATVIFHAYSCLTYCTAVIGAILADGFLGRFRTICILSVIYFIGCVVISVTAALPPPELAGPLVGLVLIAFGTGGMKPCVVSFGGDQLPSSQVKRRATFFSTFYFIINLGNILAIITTPILRSDIHCVDDTCYPAAFGVPAGLMFLASCVFIAGRNKYKYASSTQHPLTKVLGVMCVRSVSEDVEKEEDDAEKGTKKKGGKKDKKKKKGKDSEKGSKDGEDDSKKGDEGDDSKKEKDEGKDSKKKKGGKGHSKKKGSKKGKKSRSISRHRNLNTNAMDISSNAADKKEKGKKKGKGQKKKKGDKTDKADKKEKADKEKADKDSAEKKKKKSSKRKSSGSKAGSSKKGAKTKSFVDEVQMVKKLLWLFIPLPIFWALFNQQGSRWTLQASNLTFGSFGRMKPDQMQALNSLLIVVIIPVFERCVYPCLNSCGLGAKPLHRIVVGMLFCALSFVVAGLLQLKIDTFGEKPLGQNESGYVIMNTLDCKISVQGDPPPFFSGDVAPFGQSEYYRVRPGIRNVVVACPTTGLQASAPANLSEGTASRLVVTQQPGRINLLVIGDKRNKSMNGTAFVSFLQLLAWVEVAKIRIASVQNAVDPVVIKVSMGNSSMFHVFEPGSYDVAFPSVTTGQEPFPKSVGGWTKVGKTFELGEGGIYTVGLIDPLTTIDLTDVIVECYTDVKPNVISMALMVPQYVLITIGEVLFSISGLAFAYTQAPESMKMVIQTFWLLTSSVGDLIVILIVSLSMAPDQATEFFGFAVLMALGSLVFMLMIRTYTVVNPEDLRKGGKAKPKDDDKKGKNKKGGKGKKGGGKDKKGDGKGKRKGSKSRSSSKADKKGDEEKEGEGKDDKDSGKDKKGSVDKSDRSGSKGGKKKKSSKSKSKKPK